MPLSDLDSDVRIDLAACRATLRQGSRTFLAASLILPHKVRDAACCLYAFCRDADDEIDLGDNPVEANARLMKRILRIYEGWPEASPVDRAMARIVGQYAIPRELPEALLEGFAWDASGRRYESETDLLAYASRVAGSVGVMMALLMGRREPSILACAAELGVAMQLTNIARDVGEDARAGRLYLPRQWLRDAGIDPDRWLAQPVFDTALGSVVERVLEAAEKLYRRADAGIARLPLACRPGVNAARTLYWAIGEEVKRRGLDSVSDRAVVPAARKLTLLAYSLASLLLPARPIEAHALAEVRHLLDAVPAAPLPVAMGGVEAQIVWVIELFDRLERRERSRAGVGYPQRSASA